MNQTDLVHHAARLRAFASKLADDIETAALASMAAEPTMPAPDVELAELLVEFADVEDAARAYARQWTGVKFEESAEMRAAWKSIHARAEPCRERLLAFARAVRDRAGRRQEMAAQAAEVVTSVEVEPGPAHDAVRIWTRHGLAGSLIVQKGDGALIAAGFAMLERNAAHATVERGDPSGIERADAGEVQDAERAGAVSPCVREEF
jgi:hypothetical protein